MGCAWDPPAGLRGGLRDPRKPFCGDGTPPGVGSTRLGTGKGFRGRCASLCPAGIAPNITRGPQDSTVIDGMAVILNCETSGAPRPAITWQKGKGAGGTGVRASLPSEPCLCLAHPCLPAWPQRVLFELCGHQTLWPPGLADGWGAGGLRGSPPITQGSGSWPAARCSSRASPCWSRAACSSAPRTSLTPAPTRAWPPTPAAWTRRLPTWSSGVRHPPARPCHPALWQPGSAHVHGAGQILPGSAGSWALPPAMGGAGWSSLGTLRMGWLVCVGANLGCPCRCHPCSPSCPPPTPTARTRITDPPQDQSVIKGTKAVMSCGVTHDPSVDVRYV